MRTRLLLLSVATILAVPLPIAPATAQQKEVVIGMLYPLSGPTASGGLDEKHAFELFADMVNGKEPMIPGAFYQKLKGLPGLPGGARLRLVFVDHQGKPDLGQAEAERLITQEKVHALIGSWQSSVTATTSQVAERLGVPHLNAESASPGLTRRGFKWFFRTSPHDEHFSQAMFDFLADFQKKRGIKVETVAISNEDTLFGTDSAKVQRALAQKAGLPARGRLRLPRATAPRSRPRCRSSRPRTPTSGSRPRISPTRSSSRGRPRSSTGTRRSSWPRTPGTSTRSSSRRPGRTPRGT